MLIDLRVPPPVEPGAVVGVAALSGPVDPVALDAGVEGLYELGFEPLLAANLGRRESLFAGSDGERAAGFHDLISDPRVEAVFFARGGHGVLRLLPRLDWTLLARRDIAYVGYSDLTALLGSLISRTGLATFHGPMVASDLSRGLADLERESLLAALRGEPLDAAELAGWGGRCEGRLLGGCLSLLAATVGTDWQPDLEGAVLFWEDVNEPLYRVDRMLTQLRLSGTVSRLEGMVIGRFAVTEESEQELLPQLLEEWGRTLRVPVLYGLTSGHCQPNLTLALGRTVRIDADSGSMCYLR